MVNEDTYLRNLASVVARLTDLPRMIGSSSKKNRNNATRTLETNILPDLYALMYPDVNELYQDIERWATEFLVPKYQELLKQGKYEEAERYAMNWMRTIKREQDAWNSFTGFRKSP